MWLGPTAGSGNRSRSVPGVVEQIVFPSLRTRAPITEPAFLSRGFKCHPHVAGGRLSSSAFTNCPSRLISSSLHRPHLSFTGCTQQHRLFHLRSLRLKVQSQRTGEGRLAHEGDCGYLSHLRGYRMEDGILGARATGCPLRLPPPGPLSCLAHMRSNS